MLKFKKIVFTTSMVTLLVFSFLIFQPAKIYSEELACNGDTGKLVGYTVDSDTSKYYTVSGYVTDRMTDDPVKNAKVMLGRNSHTKTDSKGYFKFRGVLNSTYELKIEKEGYKDYNKSVKIDGNDLELEISLDFYTISGHITNMKADEPIEKAKITLNGSTKSSFETESNSKGYFEFRHVSKGTHSLKIEKEGYSDYHKDVKVKDNDVKLAFDLKLEKKPCNISGYVKSEKSGEAVNNARVRLSGESNWIRKTWISRTDNEGYFKFKGVLEGDYTLLVEKEGHYKGVSLVVNGVDRELNIELKDEVESIINVKVNNEKLIFGDVIGYPFIDENNRTLVPLRRVLEVFGAEVEWDNDKKMTYATKDNNTVYIPINENYIIVNDVKVLIDSKAIIKNDRIYCPIRPIIEGLDGVVTWDEKTQTVIINVGGL